MVLSYLRTANNADFALLEIVFLIISLNMNRFLVKMSSLCWVYGGKQEYIVS